MLADKAKQQEELLGDYEEQSAQTRDMGSEMELLQRQVDGIKDELQVG